MHLYNMSLVPIAHYEMELLATRALRFNKARTTCQARNSNVICAIKIQSIKITYFIK